MNTSAPDGITYVLCPIKKQGNGLDLGLLHVENLKASKDGVEVDEEPWCKMGSIMKVLKTKRRG
jgi:hypothetical protein